MDSHFLMLVLYIFLIYWFIVLILDRKGFLQRYNISSFGPILMIRTTRGEKLLERLSKGELKETFWRTYANIGTVLVVIAMIFMFVLVLLSAYATFTVQPEPTEFNEPRNWLLIPGLNKFIPLCAWVGFVVALVVHELSHAILSTVEKIKVKSMGLLVALIPIGAFAEPDSEQLFGEKAGKGEKKKVATARERTRILSAGITSNFVVAFIAFALFFSILFAIQPVSDKMLFVHGVVEGSTAEKAGIEPGMFITKVDGLKITNATIEEMDKAIGEKKEIIFDVLNKRGKQTEIIIEGGYEYEGVRIAGVEEGFPAANAGIKAGMSIIKMDGVNITGYKDFQNFMNHTAPGQKVEVRTKEKIFLVELTEAPKGNKGFLGVLLVPNNPLGMYVREFPTKGYLESLRVIPSSLLSLSTSGWLWLTLLPFLPLPAGFSSFNPLLSHLYEPVGAVSFLGGGIFVIADVLFWIGWINFYVGLFNCLPAIPLDGGYVFREILNPMLRIGIKEEGKKEKIAKAITATVAIFVASAIVFMLVGPYLF
ncbi:MAG: site-2 protease family protein [Methanophagales archaeon]|nr:site-2 protease family protein [Methanophagales archaeon]